MKAMTMPFTVRDSSMLRGIEVGDSVRGVVTVKKSEVWLDSLTVVVKMSSLEPPH
jgi:Cu/Ag efflux protein CusF